MRFKSGMEKTPTPGFEPRYPEETGFQDRRNTRLCDVGTNRQQSQIPFKSCAKSLESQIKVRPVFVWAGKLAYLLLFFDVFLAAAFLFFAITITSFLILFFFLGKIVFKFYDICGLRTIFIVAVFEDS